MQDIYQTINPTLEQRAEGAVLPGRAFVHASVAFYQYAWASVRARVAKEMGAIAKGLTNVAAKRVLMAIPLFLYLAIVFNLLTDQTDQPNEYYRLLLALISTISNGFVLSHHFTTPAHPKFRLLKKRQIALRIHIISGIVELLAALGAFFSPDPAIPAVVMAIAAFIHVGTSFFQTPTVFGAQIVTRPGYLFANSLHLFCALQLLLHPTSSTWLLNTYLVLNIYVWVRIFFDACQKLNFFPGSYYTASVLIAGLLIFPAVMGPVGNLHFITFLLAYIALYKLVMQPDATQWQALVKERARDTFINPDVKAAWQRDNTAQIPDSEAAQLDDRALAQTVFEQLDTDRNGYLGNHEIVQILIAWETHPNLVSALTSSMVGTNHQLSFDEFYRYVWNMGAMRARLRPQTVLDEQTSPSMQALIVFNPAGSGSKRIP